MQRVPPRKISHVVYRTNRYEEMISWYQEVFAARIKSKSPAMAFFTFDDEDHRFAIANLQALKPEYSERDRPGLVGVDHIAYTLDSLRDLFGNYEYLKAKGITPYWCIHHGDTVSMYYADPDGNQMEFQVRPLKPNAWRHPCRLRRHGEITPLGSNLIQKIGCSAFALESRRENFWCEKYTNPFHQFAVRSNADRTE